MLKPTIFIGSSQEGLEVARAVRFALRGDAEISIWNEGVFAPSQGTLEALVNAAERFDFAALILTADDLVQSREVSALGPRDNVLFELGLFMGALGRTRTFVICTDAPSFRLPSDLAGVTVLLFESSRGDGNLVSAVEPACYQVRQAVRGLGAIEKRGLARLGQATDKVESVSANMAHLVKLIARSRVIELEIIRRQFGSVLPSDLFGAMIKDLKDLECASRDGKDDGDRCDELG